jgi:hypothetical protein
MEAPGAEPVLDPREHLESRWESVDQALAMVAFDFQRDALRRFSCYLVES